LSDSGQVLEPQEDGVCSRADAHVGDQGDGRGDGNAVVWNTSLVALEEELGGLAVLGNSEEVARA
jgi:hypothetical protein